MHFYYPEIEPYRTDHLAVDDIHSLYVEECGNPNGVPIVFIHAGPGSYSKPYHRRMFDPAYWRIIIFDQRGCGQSTPFGELRQNTPALLVEDVERLRLYLKIERWHVMAGSWGATIGIPYCIQYPARVLSATWRCPYLFQQTDIHNHTYDLKKFRYRAWQRFTQAIGRNNAITETLYHMLRSTDATVRERAVRAWRDWQDSISLPADDLSEQIIPADKLQKTLAQFLIETEFNLFHTYPDDWFKGHEAALANIPCHIIQGGYDIVCAPQGAYELQQAWPNSTLEVVKGAGHSADDGDILPAIINHLNSLKTTAV